jgi:Flp pilus assembly pilin Flp
MQKKKRNYKELIYDESGEILVEYGLLIGLAILIFLTLLTTIDGILEWINGNLDKIFTMLE